MMPGRMLVPTLRTSRDHEIFIVSKCAPRQGLSALVPTVGSRSIFFFHAEDRKLRATQISFGTEIFRLSIPL